jgi:AraC family transcriptional regulator, alkane utilization regulator
MDALTRVLHALRLEPQIFHRLRLQTPWGMGLSVKNGAAFHVIQEGEAWLRMSGTTQPMSLKQGDLLVVSNVADYELIDTAHGSSIPLYDLLKLRDAEGVASFATNGRGKPAVMLCGQFQTEPGATSPLFSVLPSLIYIPGQEGQAVDWLTTPLTMIRMEADNDYPGKDTVISRLMDILFIMILRYWIFHHPVEGGGWFSALYHPQIGQVLSLIHRQPEQDWTVESLAAAVHMSRSSLAAQFTALVGEAPMKYLTRWRMQLATLWLLNNPQMSIEQIAAQVSYTSPYAFSKAFKRLVGVSPSEYREKALHD